MSAPNPPVIPQPFAAAGSRNVIPDTTADIQRASFQLGFPPATMTPIDAGGVPMLGPDMNGILNDVTAWLFALQGGQLSKYSSDVSDAIGGYANGALVMMADGAGYWLSTAANNTTDPDAGGAGWQPVYAYGPGLIDSLAGGIRTLSAVEATRPFLVFSGALVANQQIIVPNAWRSWLAINLTSGSFTLTVKTAAGTGAVIPQGGFAVPTAIWCDTNNVQPVFTPAPLPLSIDPDPNTIPLRDNVGRMLTPTAPLGTRTTQAASTAFANPAGDGTTWRQNPDGTIDQWGSITKQASAQGRVVIFPVEFPNAIFGVQLTSTGGLGTPQHASWMQVLGALSLTQFVINADDFGTSTPNPTITVYWRAYGR